MEPQSVSNDQQISSQPIPSSPKRKIYLFMLLIVLIVVVLGIMGYFVYKNYLKSKNSVIPAPNSTSKEEETLPITGLIEGQKTDMNLNNSQLGKVGTITVLPNWQVTYSQEDITLMGTIYYMSIKNGDYEILIHSFSSSRGDNCLWKTDLETLAKKSVYFQDLTGVEYLRFKQSDLYVKELPICSNATEGGDKFAGGEAPYGQISYKVPENADVLILNQMDNMVASFKTESNSQNSVTKTYKASQDYGGISFEYPENYPVSVAKDSAFSETNGQGISIEKFDINNFDYDQNPTMSKEEIQKYYDDELMKGKISGISPFTRWSLNSSNQIVKTKSGKYFRASTTFSAFEVCDFKFHTTLEIPINNNIVEVTIYGNTKEIRKSMANSNLLTLWEGCSEKSFAKSGAENFYQSLVSGGGTSEAKDWYNAANQVINSLDF
jgi:hypothetical protein